MGSLFPGILWPRCRYFIAHSMVDMGFKPLKALPFRVTRVFKYGENHTVTEANMTTYRSIRSKYAGKCHKCGGAWQANDFIWQCDGRYYDHSGCVEEENPGATVERSKREDKVEERGIVNQASTSTVYGTSTSVRWEIVTGDDAVREQQDRQIVLRVENVDAVFTLQKRQVHAEAQQGPHRWQHDPFDMGQRERRGECDQFLGCMVKQIKVHLRREAYYPRKKLNDMSARPLIHAADDVQINAYF